MLWKTTWDAISMRTEWLFSFINIDDPLSQKPHNQLGDDICKQLLIPELDECSNELNNFISNFSAQLPNTAVSALRKFIDYYRTRGKNSVSPIVDFNFSITFLSICKSKFEYYIAEMEYQAKSVVERAFSHLQRSIIADEEFRNKWQLAFINNENACEKLGAVHLLLHGITAFKIDSMGGRTDIVMSEPLDITTTRSTQNILLLTEWKLVDESNKEKKLQEAMTQVQLYTSEALIGLELESVKYLVMVSKERMDYEPTRLVQEKKYRVINIVVNPSKPSIYSRKIS